jgi:hypothetical protein
MNSYEMIFDSYLNFQPFKWEFFFGNKNMKRINNIKKTFLDCKKEKKHKFASPKNINDIFCCQWVLYRIHSLFLIFTSIIEAKLFAYQLIDVQRTLKCF